MLKTTSTKFGHLTDQELVALIQENQEYLGEVYKRCKKYCIQFMRKRTNGKMNEYELEDVFQDAILILYEKINKGNFDLSSSLQTYLNSVCRFQLLSKFKQLTTLDIVDNDGNSQFDGTITDDLDPVIDEKEVQFVAIEKALERMKLAGGKCYDLIIQFWYHKKSMIDLATEFEYSNDKTAKKQKSKCQERLRVLTFNELKTN